MGWFVAIGFAAFLRTLAAQALEACPNSCSFLGVCGAGDACRCPSSDLLSLYGGDCSLRRCPYAAAFADPPHGDLNHDGVISGAELWPLDAQEGEAHFPRECGGAGLCDTATGACACFPGFEGAACERAACPGSPPCSGRGVCLSVREAAARRGVRYALWDAAKGAACVCDPGYGGIDCGARECPLGPPAGHEGDVSRVSFSVPGNQVGAGYLLTLRGDGARFAPNASTPVFALSSDAAGGGGGAGAAANAAAVAAAVRALPNGGGATLLRVAVAGGGPQQLRVTLFFAGPPPGALTLAPGGPAPGAAGAVFPPGRDVHVFSLPGPWAAPGSYVPTRLQLWVGAPARPLSSARDADGASPVADLEVSTALGAATSVAAALAAVPHLRLRSTSFAVNRDVVVVLGADLVSYDVAVLLPAGTPNAPPLRVRTGNSDVDVLGKPWVDAMPLGDNFEAPSWVPCAGRGACDAVTGLCRCHPGAAGHHCAGEAVVRAGETNYPATPPAAVGGGAGLDAAV